jgi:hypothetical protein
MSCPFYAHGLLQSPGDPRDVMLIPEDSNRCALVTSAHSPCVLEIAGAHPDWGICRRNPDNHNNTPSEILYLLNIMKAKKNDD